MAWPLSPGSRRQADGYDVCDLDCEVEPRHMNVNASALRLDHGSASTEEMKASANSISRASSVGLGLGKLSPLPTFAILYLHSQIRLRS